MSGTDLMSRIASYRNDRLTFEVTDRGPLQGDPVVLLHGFPQRASSWDLVTPHLHEAGLRTYAPDLRGYSPDARPRRRRDYNLALIVDDVAALIRQIGRPVHLVGHDWGAAVAWALGGIYPELVKTLTAVSIPHFRAMVGVGLPQLRKSWYVLLNQVPGLVDMAMARPHFADALLRTAMPVFAVQRYGEEIVDTGAITTALHWYRGIPFSPTRLLHTRVSAPTTMVWSTGDRFVDRRGAEASKNFVDNDFELVIMEGIGHWIPDEAPEQLAEAIVARAIPATG